MNEKKKSSFESLISQLEDLKNFLPPINSAGYPFIILFALVAFILSLISDFLGWIGFILTLWCVYFFRDPERVTPKKTNVLISPADGKIVFSGLSKSPENLIDNKQLDLNKVSIFMNVFDVHVNRIPMSGKVIWLKYVPGTFLNASLDKSSENNERMIVKVEVSKGVFIYVVQIAGLIARRIKCDLTENESVTMGQRYGLIRFGSRVDVYFPKNFNILVNEGQTSISGETIIADFNLTKSK
ncbi:MAG: phosphatidylserine decarboxylase family protein [Rickettsiales bacterium]|nr:phosphatidylserine decarboxylase family protein [Rickettsiales bacterium]RPG15063.1 MAG: phosphatidylserine decarboxylase [Pelagibacteraceae bacterium TMED195]|tara:strand:+ start:1016 stop:1738 length:723 start_codon:yes stop_codon:yes gene_type:complete